MRPGVVVAGVVMAGAAFAADPVPTEVNQIDDTMITLYLYPFLTEEEVSLLRLVATNADALAVFVPEGGGFAAIAVAPREGFVRDGQPVESAVAVAHLPDAATARDDALAGCMAAKKRGPDCVIVLEVAAPPGK